MPGLPLPEDRLLLGLILIGAEMRLAALRPFAERAWTAMIDEEMLPVVLDWEREINSRAIPWRHWELAEPFIQYPWRREDGSDDAWAKNRFLRNKAKAYDDREDSAILSPEICLRYMELLWGLHSWGNLMERATRKLLGKEDETPSNVETLKWTESPKRSKTDRIRARNKFCYELLKRGKSYEEIAAEVKKRPGLEPLGKSGVSSTVGQACRAHAKRTGDNFLDCTGKEYEPTTRNKRAKKDTPKSKPSKKKEPKTGGLMSGNTT